jgi:hypothetical protein
VGEPKVGERAKQEGITDYCFIPVLQAPEWFDEQCDTDLNDPNCNLPGGKTEHALLKLFHLCDKEGIQ